MPYSLENSRLITLCRTRLAAKKKQKLKAKLDAAPRAKAQALVGGGVKKTAADADYKKRRRQPLSEEALAQRRAAAQKAAITRKQNATPVKSQIPTPVKQVRVFMRFDHTLIPKGRPSPKMLAPSSGRLVDVGSDKHWAAKRGASLGYYRYWM